MILLNRDTKFIGCPLKATEAEAGGSVDNNGDSFNKAFKKAKASLDSSLRKLGLSAANYSDALFHKISTAPLLLRQMGSLPIESMQSYEPINQIIFKSGFNSFKSLLNPILGETEKHRAGCSLKLIRSSNNGMDKYSAERAEILMVPSLKKDDV